MVVERPSQLLWACCLSLNASSLAGDFCVERFYLTEVDMELANKCGKLKKYIGMGTWNKSRLIVHSESGWIGIVDLHSSCLI